MNALASGVWGTQTILIALVLQNHQPAEASSIPVGIGPFRIELRSQSNCPASEKCDHPEKMVFSNIKVSRDANNMWKYTFNADVNTTVPFDDSYKADILITRWGQNGWANNVFRVTATNPCSTFKARRPDIFKRMSDLYYDGTLTDCPITPVSAEVRDFTMESPPPSNLKALPYGRFRTRIKLVDPNQECIHCHDVVTDVLPKRH